MSVSGKGGHRDELVRLAFDTGMSVGFCLGAVLGMAGSIFVDITVVKALFLGAVVVVSTGVLLRIDLVRRRRVLEIIKKKKADQ